MKKNTVESTLAELIEKNQAMYDLAIPLWGHSEIHPITSGEADALRAAIVEVNFMVHQTAELVEKKNAKFPRKIFRRK